MSGSWAFRSQRVGVSFLGHIVTERLRQSATDEQKDTPVESQSTETEQPAKSHPTETRSPDELQATDTEQPGGSSDLATQRLIDDAREQLSDSPQEAVRIAYTTTRSHFNSPDEATSREFYDNTRDRVSATDDLQQLVDIYERAMFREQIERDEAEKAVEAASTLISEVK